MGEKNFPSLTLTGNSIELWGRVAREPELRTTPAGTAILHLVVDCGQRAGEMTLAVVMTGEAAQRVRPSLRSGSQVRVKGSLRAVRRRLKSSLFETGYEVIAAAITMEKITTDKTTTEK